LEVRSTEPTTPTDIYLIELKNLKDILWWA
jgi:hypothetical protein